MDALRSGSDGLGGIINFVLCHNLFRLRRKLLWAGTLALTCARRSDDVKHGSEADLPCEQACLQRLPLRTFKRARGRPLDAQRLRRL